MVSGPGLSPGTHKLLQREFRGLPAITRASRLHNILEAHADSALWKRATGVAENQRLGPLPAHSCQAMLGATCGPGLGISQHLPGSHGDVINVRGTFQKKRAWCLFNTWLLSSTEAYEMSAWAAAQPGSSAYACVSHTPAPAIQVKPPGDSFFP